MPELGNIDKISITIVNPETRDRETYEFADAAAALGFLQDLQNKRQATQG